MKRYFDEQRTWPSTRRVPHLYIVPNLDQNVEADLLLRHCRRVMAGHPATRFHIPRDLLHITVQSIGGDLIDLSDGTDILKRERQADLVASLRTVFDDSRPIDVTLGSPLLYNTGVLMDIDPDDQISALIDRSRRAVASVLGAQAVAVESWPAHMTLCYAIDDHDADDLSRDLRRIRPSHAPLTIDAVHLVDVWQEPHQGVYGWETIETFSLGQP